MFILLTCEWCGFTEETETESTIHLDPCPCCGIYEVEIKKE